MTTEIVTTTFWVFRDISYNAKDKPQFPGYPHNAVPLNFCEDTNYPPLILHNQRTPTNHPQYRTSFSFCVSDNISLTFDSRVGIVHGGEVRYKLLQVLRYKHELKVLMVYVVVVSKKKFYHDKYEKPTKHSTWWDLLCIFDGGLDG